MLLISSSASTYSENIIEVKTEDIKRTCNGIMKVMKTELPEEVQSIEVLEHVLKECKSMLYSEKKLQL